MAEAPLHAVSRSLPADTLERTVARLAQQASLEISIRDAKSLPASRSLLAPGKRLYVNHMPGQSWKDTEGMCRLVRDAGFEPIPHLPVRLIETREVLESTLAGLVQQAGVNEVLLIAGDYPAAAGPYSSVSEVLLSGMLSKHGISRVSVAGHPEGHPKVALEEIRRAEREKVQQALDDDLEVTILTQFFFEAAPFLQWVRALRADGIRARVVAGLAGPATLTTLFRFAMRCGVGPSIKALGARPGSLIKLMGDQGPEEVLYSLARALLDGTSEFQAVHLFSFGGYLRTCEWLNRASQLAGGGRSLLS
jgi:methylenetetrahydrofolate reductase (NADPH)